MKNLDKRRSRSLAGMFTIALDYFIDSQNFVHAFTVALSFVLSVSGFLCLQKLLNFDFILARSFLG